MVCECTPLISGWWASKTNASRIGAGVGVPRASLVSAVVMPPRGLQGDVIVTTVVLIRISSCVRVADPQAVYVTSRQDWLGVTHLPYIAPGLRQHARLNFA